MILRRKANKFIIWFFHFSSWIFRIFGIQEISSFVKYNLSFFFNFVFATFFFSFSFFHLIKHNNWISDWLT